MLMEKNDLKNLDESSQDLSFKRDRMKKIAFTLQDAPDFVMETYANIQPNTNGEYTVAEENALAILIYEHFPQLKKCHRRIKQLIVVDEAGQKYETENFAVPGSLQKIQNDYENKKH